MSGDPGKTSRSGSFRGPRRHGNAQRPSHFTPGRAAEALNTTQSNVSARIRKLEQEFEGPLFLRLHRSIAPTAKGELAYRYARDVIQRADKVAEAIRNNNEAA